MQKIKNILSWLKQHSVVTGILTVILVLCLLIVWITTANAGSLIKGLKTNVSWILLVLICVLTLVVAWAVIVFEEKIFTFLRKRPLTTMLLAIIAGIILLPTMYIIIKCCVCCGFAPGWMLSITLKPPPWSVIGGIVAAPPILVTWMWQYKQKESGLENDANRMRTDLYVKAVELIGGNVVEKQISGLYTMEMISKESEIHHRSVIETLCSYIRHNAPWTPEKENEKNARPAIGIQIAMQIIGRRSEERRKQEKEAGYKLDLHGTALRGVDLTGAHLEDAILRDAHLEGAILHNAHLDRATLDGAHLDDANLLEADVTKATFVKTRLHDVHFTVIYGLSQSQINSALGNENTALPDGLDVPSTWPPNDWENAKKKKPGELGTGQRLG